MTNPQDVSYRSTKFKNATVKWKRTTICLWNCGGQAVAAEQQKDYSLLLFWDDIKKHGVLY